MTNAASLYIHYPYCKHLCNYCDFYKKPLSSNVDYGQLEKQLRRHLADIEGLESDNNARLAKVYDTVYLGGGTPSLWGKEGAEFLSSFFGEAGIETAVDAEFTMEVDPGAWSVEGLSAWKSAGVNRFSIGVQAFDEEFIKIMDRSHDLGEARSTLSYFQKNKENFSVDLMLGLPRSGELKRDVLKELESLLDYGPSHFSVYILKTRANYPLKDFLPDDDAVSDEYFLVSEFLRSQGFAHYEVSNFAKEGKESRHNLKYWSAKTVHALGPNATGFLRTGGDSAVRYQHKPSGTGISVEKLGATELKLEEVYLGLRTNRGLDLKDFFAAAQIEKLSKKWSDLGYVESCCEGRLILNPKGFLMIDSLMDDLFIANML